MNPCETGKEALSDRTTLFVLHPSLVQARSLRLVAAEMEQLLENLESRIIFLLQRHFRPPIITLHLHETTPLLAILLFMWLQWHKTEIRVAQPKQSDEAVNGSSAEILVYHLCSEMVLVLLRPVWQVLVKARLLIEWCSVAL
jgi:hypothetical protein